MNFQQVIDQASSLFREAQFISKIDTDVDYELAMQLMDTLVDDYENQKPLIDVLSRSIEEWENRAEGFADFNRQVETIDSDVALLRTLMDQFGLTANDLKDEIGSKSLVSMILNGSRNLTTRHIRALSVRFHVNPALFLR
jgi:HTH-type transcriptional regulator/antitoxin HigA